MNHKDFTVCSEKLDAHFKVNEPLLRAALYPRRILSSHNYLDPRHYSACLSAAYRLWLRADMKLLPHTTGCMMALMMSKHGTPTYFVEPEFAEAVAHTEPPEDFYLKDIKWPMPAMAFVLPDAFVMRYFKFYSPFIGVARVPSGVYPQDARPYPKTEHDITYASPLGVEGDRIIMHFPLFMQTDAPFDYTANYKLDSPLSVIKTPNFTNAIPFEEHLYSPEYANRVHFKPIGPQGAEEPEFQISVVSFAIKLMLALTARPEYIECGLISRQAKIGKKAREALYTPNVIGKKYRVLRPPAPVGEPTGRSAPLHWVPGHMTHQVFGSRKDFISIYDLPRKDKRVDWPSIPKETLERFWACHRFIWINPYLVNAPSEIDDTKHSG